VLLAGVTAAAVVAAFAVQSMTAHADETGFLDVGTLRVETSGAAADSLNQQRTDVDLPDEGLGFEVNFNELIGTLNIPSSEFTQNIDEAQFEQVLGNAAVIVNNTTGYSLDDNAEVGRLRTELNTLRDAVNGYNASPPASPDPRVASITEALDLLPFLDREAECRGRCLEEGALRPLAAGGILELIKFTVNKSDVPEATKTAVEATMITLQILVPAGFIVLTRFRALTPEQRAQFASLGIFTALGNLYGLVLDTLVSTVTAIGGGEAFTTLTTQVARNIVDNAAPGAPADAVVIDIHDEL
jgi:hypothetical protein